MTGWLLGAGIPLAYLAGATYTARRALPLIMSRLVCAQGFAFLSICREYHGQDCGKPVGVLRPRQLSDAALAVALGFGWPVTVWAVWVFHSAPLAEGEQARLSAEQDARIRQLEQQLRDMR